MTLTYKDKNYTVTNDSIYTDFSIVADGLADAVVIVDELADMSTYTFDLNDCADLKVIREMIIIENGTYTVKVKLRHQTELEKTKAELSEVRAAIADINISDADAAKHPELFPDIKDVDEIVAGQYYVIDGVTQLVTEVINDKDDIKQYVSKKAMGATK